MYNSLSLSLARLIKKPALSPSFSLLSLESRVLYKTTMALGGQLVCLGLIWDPFSVRHFFSSHGIVPTRFATFTTHGRDPEAVVDYIW